MPLIARIAGATAAALAASLGLAAGAGATFISRVEAPQGATIRSVDEGFETAFDVIVIDGSLRFDGFNLRAGKGCAVGENGVVNCPVAGVTGLTLQGGAAADRITISSTGGIPSVITGGAGNDELEAGAGPQIFGGIRPGGDSPVTLIGGDGNDTLFGGAKADTIDGGPGKDEVWGGDGPDTLLGGDGDDALVAWGDGAADNLDCGGGSDHHHLDRGLDTAANCELGPRDADLAPTESVLDHRFTAFRDGTILRRLRVRKLPAPAVVTVTCKGHGCPYKKRKRSLASPPSKLDLVGPFKRHRLAPGARVEVTVATPDRLSKRVRLVMRRSKAPDRSTYCVGPTSGKTYTCPNTSGDVSIGG